MVELGNRAASHGKPLFLRLHEKVQADWLVQRNLATVSSAGQLVLLGEALESLTTLAKPVSVTGPEQNLLDSVWGLRRKLMKLGWTQKQPSAASVAEKAFNDKNCFKQYLALLLDSASIALAAHEFRGSCLISWPRLSLG